MHSRADSWTYADANCRSITSTHTNDHIGAVSGAYDNAYTTALHGDFTSTNDMDAS